MTGSRPGDERELEAGNAELRARIEESVREIRACMLQLYALAHPTPPSQFN
jgi:hypothetical protein